MWIAPLQSTWCKRRSAWAVMEFDKIWLFVISIHADLLLKIAERSSHCHLIVSDAFQVTCCPLLFFPGDMFTKIIYVRVKEWLFLIEQTCLTCVLPITSTRLSPLTITSGSSCRQSELFDIDLMRNALELINWCHQNIWYYYPIQLCLKFQCHHLTCVDHWICFSYLLSWWTWSLWFDLSKKPAHITNKQSKVKNHYDQATICSKSKQNVQSNQTDLTADWYSKTTLDCCLKAFINLSNQSPPHLIVPSAHLKWRQQLLQNLHQMYFVLVKSLNHSLSFRICFEHLINKDLTY